MSLQKTINDFRNADEFGHLERGIVHEVPFGGGARKMFIEPEPEQISSEIPIELFEAGYDPDHNRKALAEMDLFYEPDPEVLGIDVDERSPELNLEEIETMLEEGAEQLDFDMDCADLCELDEIGGHGY